jgi:hypothetical protein
VEMLPEMGSGMERVSKALLFKRLKALPTVTLFTSTTVLCVGKEALVLQGPEGVRTLPPVESVLLATGLWPENIPDALKTLVPEVHVVGDAKLPRDVESAVQDGYETARAV